MKFKKHRAKLPLSLLTAVSLFIAGFLSYRLIPQGGQFSLLLNPQIQPAPAPTESLPLTSFESLDVCFTPNQSCLPKVLKAIDTAQSSIILLGYSFTSKPITHALIRAKKRGIKIRMVLDHSQKSQKYSKDVIQELIKNHVDVRFDHSVKIAHNKILVIDNLQTLSGSYNWTHSAEFKNAENLMFIKSPEVARKYTKYFEERWNVSRSLSVTK